VLVAADYPWASGDVFDDDGQVWCRFCPQPPEPPPLARDGCRNHGHGTGGYLQLKFLKNDVIPSTTVVVCCLQKTCGQFLNKIAMLPFYQEETEVLRSEDNNDELY
jgi:hypothetical protein